jgi:hypothetical protein
MHPRCSLMGKQPTRVGMREFSKSPHVGFGLQLSYRRNSHVRTCGITFFASFSHRAQRQR